MRTGTLGYWHAHSDRDWYGESEDYEPEPEEEYDESEECGRWRNGKLVIQCENAGTEWCDWQCPIGLPNRAKVRR